MADAEIRSVFLGVTGGHMRGFNNRGVHPVVSADREISEEDVQDVIKNAKAINLPAQNHVIHAIRQHFLVDGQDGITNPVGMLGARVEVDVHVVHGNLNRLQNVIRAVKGLQLDVDDIVFNGLAYRTGGGVCSRPLLRHLQLPCLAVALPPSVVLRNAPRIRDKSAFDINEHF